MFETIDPTPPEVGDGGKDSSASLSSPSSGATPKPAMSSFVEHLVRNKIVTGEVAIKATIWKNQLGGKDRRSMIDILVEEFGLSRDALHLEMAKFYSFRVVDLSDRSPRTLQSSQVHKLMSELPQSINQLAFKHKVLPYETGDGQSDKLLVVTPNPSDREVYDVARAFPYKRFEICYMSDKDWTEYWRQVTLDKQQSNNEGELGEAAFDEEDPELDSILDKEVNRSELIALIENIYTDAVRVNASDIHLVPRGPRKTEILFRLDGQLTLWRTIDDARAEAVVAIVKGKSAHLDRFERMAAQDGSAQKIVDNQVIRFRMSVLPIISRSSAGKFESVVIRILREANTNVKLETIGFDPYSLRVFSEAIAKPHGIVILTGPTGSGKSTTLVAALRAVMKPTLNTITVEDPPEYLIEEARQVKLNHKLDFEGAMRAILRHDPDIVMLGEIRDRITADIAIKLANTGHLTLTTLHTNDAPSAVSRLFKMGVEPFLIAQALNIVVGQRLVRKLCERCRKPMINFSNQVLLRLGFTQEETEKATLFRAVGCPQCVEGYKGRTAIHESLFVTPQIRETILESKDKIDLDAIRKAALDHGMQSLRRSGIELIKKGITSVEEVAALTTGE